MDIQYKNEIENKMLGRLWAYAPVIHSNGPGLGVAIANEQGYSPVPRAWVASETYEHACTKADELNAERGLDKHTALLIVASTMQQDLKQEKANDGQRTA